MDISVVIPSYNSIETIVETLGALEAQNTCCDYEIIVVDCSDNDLVERAVDATPKGKCIRRQTRFNPGEGRNIGAKAAKGTLLVFVDSDVVLAESALDRAWQFHQQGHRLFGGALELNEQHHPTAASYLEHYFFNHEAQRRRPARERLNLSSALMMVARDLFMKAGGFMDIPRMQDTELTERLRRKGVRLDFAPAVIGFQIQDSPMRKVLKKIFINGQNIYSIRYSDKMTTGKKLLFLILLPVLALLKVVRIVVRHLCYQDLRKRGITVLLVPLFLVSGFYWMVGFYKGILCDPGVSQER